MHRHIDFKGDHFLVAGDDTTIPLIESAAPVCYRHPYFVFQYQDYPKLQRAIRGHGYSMSKAAHTAAERLRHTLLAMKAQQEAKVQMSLRLIDTPEAQAILAPIGPLEDFVIDTGSAKIHLYKHQIETIKRAVAWKRLIAALDMGLGKSLLSAVYIRAMQLYRPEMRAIVVGPVSLEGVWMRECGWVGARIEFYSYGKIPEAALVDGPFVFIADEAQAFQTWTSQRTQAARALANSKYCEGLLLLSGTPNKNGRGANMYPLLWMTRHPIAYPETKKRAYEQRYCAAKPTRFSQWDTSGSSNEKELHALIALGPDACMYRLKKEDCLDLPTKTRIMKPLNVDPAVGRAYYDRVDQMREEYEERIQVKLQEFIAEEFEKFAAEHPTLTLTEPVGDVQQMQAQVFSIIKHHAGPDAADAFIVAVQGKEDKIRSATAMVTMGHLRLAGSQAKAKAALDAARELLDEGQPLVLFSSFKETASMLVEELNAAGYRAGKVDGEMPKKKRDEVVDAFQAGDLDVFVGTFGAAGTGITLTRAKYLFLLDRPWTPGDAQQAEDRIYRIGQKEAVIMAWLQMPETISEIDLKIDNILQTKQLNISRSIDGNEAPIPMASDAELLDSLIKYAFSEKKAKRKKKAA